MNLLSLPEELQLQILSYLPPSSLPHLSLVCKTTYHLCNDPALWAWLCVRDQGVRPRDSYLAKQFYRDFLHHNSVISFMRGREDLPPCHEADEVYDDSFSLDTLPELEQTQLFLKISTPALVGAEIFELYMGDDGKVIGSYRVGSRSGLSVVQISEKLHFYDVLFYVRYGGNHDVLSVNGTVAEYNRFREHDFT